MPLWCTHYRTGEVYDYKSLEGRKRWNEKQEDGKTSSWLLEDGTPWTPTDVHSETAHNALVVGLGYTCIEKFKTYTHSSRPHIDEHAFKEFWRKKGKTFNFMRNYGGGAKKAAETLDISMEIAEALVNGWSASFPEVAYYQNVVINTVRMEGYYENMYGRRYYMSNWYWAYKVGNYNVQGSSADFLKWAMIKLDEFFKANGIKTKMLASIHDEIQFLKRKGEEWIAPHIKQLMEECDWMMVPVVVEAEVTKTNWAEKSHLEVAA
jgi:DNA polymerase-1